MNVSDIQLDQFPLPFRPPSPFPFQPPLPAVPTADPAGPKGPGPAHERFNLFLPASDVAFVSHAFPSSSFDRL